MPAIRLRECVTEVEVLGPAAVAGEPTRVHAQLHEICEAPDILRSGGSSAPQMPGAIHVHWIFVLRDQVRIDEAERPRFIPCHILKDDQSATSLCQALCSLLLSFEKVGNPD